MSRVQLSINVSDFAAVAFYSRLFGTGPAKLWPGYANFAIDDPPLKLVLNSPGNSAGGTTNHLGVEVDSAAEVTRAGDRLITGGGVLPRTPGQGMGARPRRGGPGVLHRPGARRDAMIPLGPARLRPPIRVVAAPAWSAEWLRLARLARTLSWVTLGWLGIEAGVAIGAAVTAGSVALLGFGLDSGIEALASIIVIWRFTGTRLLGTTAERRAQHLVSVSFYLLAPYIAAEAIWGLIHHEHPETSITGLALTAVTAILEPGVGLAKRRIGTRLSSAATVGEGTQNLLCSYLAIAVFAGLLANTVFGAWWLDGSVALAIAGWAIAEGRRTWAGRSCGCACAAAATDRPGFWGLAESGQRAEEGTGGGGNDKGERCAEPARHDLPCHPPDGQRAADGSGCEDSRRRPAEMNAVPDPRCPGSGAVDGDHDK